MERYQKALTTIKKILSDNPRGLSIQEIAAHIKTNRNSVAKYLDVLVMTGTVETRKYGTARVFFPTKRVPTSSLMDFSSTAVCILDAQHKIVQMNKSAEKMSGYKGSEVIGSKITELDTCILNQEEISQAIEKGYDGQEQTISTQVGLEPNEKYFNLRIIPTSFEDGTSGVTVLIDDYTERKKARIEREQIYRAVIEDPFKPIVILGEHLDIIFSNTYFATMVGKDRSEVNGDDFFSYVIKDDQKRLLEYIRKVRSHQLGESVLVHMNAKKGIVLTRIKIAIITTPQNKKQAMVEIFVES